MKKICLILVDDHLFFRANCRRFLEKTEDFEIIGEFKTEEEAINTVKEKKPDFVIIGSDFSNSYEINPIKTFKNISHRTRFIILTSYFGSSLIKKLVQIGVSGYISKEDEIGCLVPAVRNTMGGEIYLSPTVQKYYSELFSPLPG